MLALSQAAATALSTSVAAQYVVMVTVCFNFVVTQGNRRAAGRFRTSMTGMQ
jgi:hypothetical protein